MQLLTRLFNRRPQEHTQDAAPGAVRQPALRPLLKKAVRDTFREHGIPDDWIVAEIFHAVTARQTPGLHLRLTVREWHPTFMDHAFALQQAITGRLACIDPLAPTWLAGVTWKFKLSNASACPVLPPPGHWQAMLSATPDAPAAAPGHRAATPARQAIDAQMRRNDAAFRASQDDFTPTTPMCLPQGAR